MTLDDEFGEVGLLQRGAKRADRLSETCYGAAKPVFEVRCYSSGGTSSGRGGWLG